MRLVFDLETDGLLDSLSKINSLVIKDLDDPEVFYSFGSFDPKGIEEGAKMLMKADTIIGHNIIGFDLLALRKVYPWFEVSKTSVIDTLVLSYLIYPDITEACFRDANGKKILLSPKLSWSHSLEAWGHRLSFNKQEYSGGWEEWNEEMQEYCERDVEVTAKLYSHLSSRKVSQRACDLEHAVKFICVEQERQGVLFDVKRAEELVHTLQKKSVHIREELQKAFPPIVKTTTFIPKASNSKKGYVKGVPFEKVSTTIFNPGSRKQIEDRLCTTRLWMPKDFTDKGQAKIDEKVLSSLPWPEASLLSEYFTIQKRLGQIVDGDKAWLKLVKGNRIHGSIITNGAVTGRCTHLNPNMAQVPAVGAPYGVECRSCFTVPDDKVQVGADVSGLELRMLAHYMSKFDGGKFSKEVIEGDIHWQNVQSLGLVGQGENRSENSLSHFIYRRGAKTFIYAFIYGAGSEKIGRIIYELGLEEKKSGLEPKILNDMFKGKEAVSSSTLRSVGSDIKNSFLRKTPALKTLMETVLKTIDVRGYLLGLDGRHLPVRSKHSGLNTLLQSAGAVTCKKWMVEIDKEIEVSSWRDKVKQILFVHDELQFEVDPSISELFGRRVVDCISRAGDFLKVSVPLTGEFKIGKNWSDCH